MFIVVSSDAGDRCQGMQGRETSPLVESGRNSPALKTHTHKGRRPERAGQG